MPVCNSIRAGLLGLAVAALTAAGCSLPSAGIFTQSKPGLKNPVALHLPYAKLHEESGNLTEARKSYETVLAEEPKSVEAILGLARIDHLAGREREAEQGFLKALKIAPNDPRTLDAAGQFYASQNRWQESVSFLNQAMLAAPTEPVVRYHLAVALARSGEINAAMPHFAKTIGDAEAHYNVGHILYDQGELDAAEQQFLQAVVKKPDLADAQYWLDEVRREKDAKQMLAGTTPPSTNARYQELAPPPGAAAPQPRSSAGRVQQSSYGQEQAANQVFAAGHQAPQRGAGAQGFASPRAARDQEDLRPASQRLSAAQSAVPANLTPQQIEQAQNQLRR